MIKISFPNIKTVIADFTRFGNAIDPKGLLTVTDEIQRAFFNSNKQVFKNKGGASGSWKPLSKPYAKWKAKKRPGKPLMVFDGDLKKSLTKKDKNNIYSPSIRGKTLVLKLGSQVEYAGYHQEGAKPLPVRRVVDPGSKEIVALFKPIQKHIVKAGRKIDKNIRPPAIPGIMTNPFNRL